MKKCIFIIEDRLKDMEDFFIFLHELLLGTMDQNTGEDLTLDQVKVFFLHICWDMGTADGAKGDFQKIWTVVEDRVKKVTGGEPFQTEYHPILWQNDSYDQNSSEKHSSEILEQIDQLREKEAAVPSAEIDYVVLMDVILSDAADKDMRWLAEGNDVPTSCLYRELTDSRCIAYSKYPKAIVLEKWREQAGMDESIRVFKRIYLTRSRGVYLPLEEKLHGILGITRNQR